MYPNDEQRFCEFIWSLYDSKQEIDSDLLARWLIEVAKWNDELAEQFAFRVDQGLSLLKSRDR